MQNPFRKVFQPKLKLVKGTRFTSFLFIATSIVIAAGILLAANMYYNIDTGEVIVEEIQRVTGVLRATAGLIVGGGATENPAAGFVFEVVGPAKFRATTTIAAPARLFVDSGYFHGAQGEYLMVGVTNDRFHIVKAGTAYEVCDTSGNCVGQGVGLGGTGAPGQVAYWIATTTLAGSNNLFWDTTNNRLGIGTTTPAYTLDVRGIIRTGGVGVPGQLIITNSNGFNLAFQATATMAAHHTYTWPKDYGANLQVLSTDGAGNLSWVSVEGVGGLTGQGTVNRVARWIGTQSLGNAGILDTTTGGFVALTLSNATTVVHNVLDPTNVDAFTLIGNIVGSGTVNITDITEFRGVRAIFSDRVESPLYTSPGVLTIRPGGTSDIVLDPTSGRIQLEAGDWIRTAGGFEIGRAGTQILREMVPIFGFDLPTRTGTTTYVAISRTIESYPFSGCSLGTTRVHKLVIRYADTFPTASTSDWQIWNTTLGASTHTFTVPGSPATGAAALADGVVHIATTTIPTPAGACTGWSQGAATDDWQVRLRLPFTGEQIQVYQIFLAAYDQIL